jgi:hypothetical protein
LSLIKQARKAKKILTEFDLKGNEKLRIYVYFWGDESTPRSWDTEEIRFMCLF